MSDDLTLHPRVRQAIYEGKRDRPLTLNWAPVERDAYDCLGLPPLSNRNAMKARTQIITEALAAGDRYISYSRDNHFYTHGQRYYRSTYSYHSILPAAPTSVINSGGSRSVSSSMREVMRLIVFRRAIAVAFSSRVLQVI